MSVKSKSRLLGRMIRRITGLPLPIAMKIGKQVAQNKDSNIIRDKFSAHVSSSHYKCGDGCCSFDRYVITGPKGSIEADYDIREGAIRKEYGFLKACPGRS